METDRRALLGSLAALAPFMALERAMAQAQASKAAPLKTADADLANKAHADLAGVPGLTMYGKERIAMLLYPGFTALDVVGPHYFFACMMGGRVDLVTPGADLAPVASDLGLAIAPTARLEDIAPGLDILFVPGGTGGTVAAMRSAQIRDFVVRQARMARYVTSVCTGSMLLAACGLLTGKRATSHWVTRPLLAEFGAIPVEARVVTDGRIVTGAGVSAGMDFALAIVGALRGAPYAQMLMLQAEYRPEPPFPGGTPATTDPAIAEPMALMFSSLTESIRQIARAQG